MVLLGHYFVSKSYQFQILEKAEYNAKAYKEWLFYCYIPH